MAATNRKMRSGNLTLVMFDNKEIGVVQSLRMSDNYGQEPAQGIGDIHVVEYVPSTARHQLSVSKMVLIAEKARDAGVFVENGDSALKGVVFDIVVQDKPTGTVLRKYTGCSMDSGDIEVSSGKITVSNAQFNALDVSGVGV